MLAVEADLRAESAGLRVTVDGHGSVITCRLEGKPVDLLRALRRNAGLLAALRAATPYLTRTGLRIDVVVGSLRVARAGLGVEQNAAARILKLPGVHVGP